MMKLFKNKTNILFLALLFSCIVVSLFSFSGTVIAKDDPAKFREVSFPTSDGGTVFANLYGKGDNAVVLAHGAVFNKESWHKQALLLAEKGFRVLSIDFRGYGKSRPATERNGLHLDVLAAVRYLHQKGAKRVSVVGGSMGGGAAARASIEAKDGEIDGLILLAHAPVAQPQKLKGRILFIVSQGDGLKRRIQQQFQAAPAPKKLTILSGKAHAQHIFRTKYAEELSKHIVDWLSARRPQDRKR